MAVPVLTPAEALDLVQDGMGTDAVGPMAGLPLIAVRVGDGRRDAVTERWYALAPGLPCVVVGVASEPTGDEPRYDVMLTDAPAPRAPWVACLDGTATVLAELHAAVERSPQAAVTLAQLLRFGPQLTIDDALVLESLAYSTLQSGAVFRDWLATRPPPKPRPDTSGEPAVLIDRDGARLGLTLNRPHVRNAFSAEMRDALVAALQIAIADPSIEEVRLRGAGPAFCSGGDLAEFGTTPDPATGHVVRTTRSAGRLLSQLADKVACDVHGACVGAGIELPAFGGRILSAPDAFFMLPEVAMGLVPGAGGTVSIPRRIGASRTAFMALTSRRIDAETAIDWGLIDEIDPR